MPLRYVAVGWPPPFAQTTSRRLLFVCTLYRYANARLRAKLPLWCRSPVSCVASAVSVAFGRRHDTRVPPPLASERPSVPACSIFACVSRDSHSSVFAIFAECTRLHPYCKCVLAGAAACACVHASACVNPRSVSASSVRVCTASPSHISFSCVHVCLCLDPHDIEVVVHRNQYIYSRANV